MRAIITFFAACLAEILFSLVCFLSFSSYGPTFLVSYFGFTVAFALVIAICIASAIAEGKLNFRLNIPYGIAIGTAVVLLIADSVFMSMSSQAGIEETSTFFNLIVIAIATVSCFVFCSFTNMVQHKLSVITLVLSGLALIATVVESMICHFGFGNLTDVLAFAFILGNIIVTTIASSIYQSSEEGYSLVGNISTLFFTLVSILVGLVMVVANPSNTMIIWVFQLVILTLHLIVVATIKRIPIRYYDFMNRDR